MRFHVLTLFPQMILDGLNTSITGRAIQNGILSVDALNIRDFAENKYMAVVPDWLCSRDLSAPRIKA